tara:strand:- start:20167 stop:20622 length:456 start_codon:yes stop_codon:yes gene_type:complete
MARITSDQYFLAMALLVAKRGTCARRQVGCVLVDSNNFVLATGYNGNPRGAPHCIEQPCEGAQYKGTGLGLDICEAIHAEQNALLQCKNTEEIEKAYVTLSPCMTCTKLLLNTTCKEIIFLEEYVDNKNPKRIWTYGETKRKWTKFTGTFI